MALFDTLYRSLLASMAIAALVACGKPSGQRAPFKPPSAAEASPAKGGTPAGALPSRLVAGDVAAYQALLTEPGPPKIHAAASALPSAVSTGGSAAYTPPVPTTGE